MSVLISPNMNLPVPSVGTEPGPDYAADVNACMTLIDQHTHAPGSGVPISPDGMNINADLSFNGQFAIDVAGVGFTAQGGIPSNGTIYMSGVDLFFVDDAGNNVRLTQSGAVAGTPGSISNLVSPASASYVALSSTFVWQSNTNIAANMDFGAAIMRNLSPNSTFALTLRPPAALSSNFTLTLPNIPGSTSFLTLDTSGNITGSIATSGGITASNIAAGTQIPVVIAPIDDGDSPYTVGVGTGMIVADATSGVITINLYTPVGNSGKRVIIQRTSTNSVFNAVTVTGTGLSTTLNTNGETITVISDGAAWSVIDRQIPNVRQSYTPGTTNLGTVSAVSFIFWRDGSDVIITGSLTIGNTTNALGSINMPSGVAIDTAALGGTALPVGVIGSGTNNGSNLVLYDGSTNSAFFFGGPLGAGSVVAAPQNSNVSFTNGTSQRMGITRIPVAGWNS